MSDELRDELARVAADTIWRIHGPESTDRESAEMDGSDVADALLPIVERRIAQARAEMGVCWEIRAERDSHEGKGWTAEHDREHGATHLTGWANDYAGRQPVTRENLIKAASLLVAAIELLDQEEANDD